MIYLSISEKENIINFGIDYVVLILMPQKKKHYQHYFIRDKIVIYVTIYLINLVEKL